MEFNNQSFAVPDLEAVIDREPLIVSPDTPLTEAIALMSEVRNLSGRVEGDRTNSEFSSSNDFSCVLIAADSKLLGILTERDIVKLAAEKLAFESVIVADVMTQPVRTWEKSNLQDVFAALFLFRRYQIRHLPIVDEEKRLIGIVSPETIRQAIKPYNLLRLIRVKDVMNTNIIHASATDTVLDVARLMTRHRVSCVIITEEDEAEAILLPVGIITERDILQFQVLQISLDNIEARQVMSAPLFLLNPEDSLLAAQEEMQLRRVRRLVVAWNWGQGLGIITQTSMLRVFDPIEMYSVIEVLQSTVQQLEREKAELLALLNRRN